MNSPQLNHLTAFGSSLRKIRLEMGLSQESLAFKAGIDRSYLGAIERGEHNLSLKNIHKLAEALNVSPALLFTISVEIAS